MTSSLSVLRERVEQWAAQIDHAILTMPAPVEARALLVERVNLLRDVLLLLVERETPHQQEKKQGETRVDEGQSNTPRSGSTAASNEPDLCFQCDGDGYDGIHNCPRCGGSGQERPR